MVEHLQCVVEVTRVRAFGLDDRAEFADVVTPEVALHHALASEHPVGVALKRVDFAVVGHEAAWLSTVPTGERVRRESRVNHRKVRGVVGVLQIFVKWCDLLGHQHTLVDDDLRRERADVKHQVLVEFAFDANPAAGVFSDDEQFAFERILIETVGGCDEELFKIRHAEQGGGANVGT